MYILHTYIYIGMFFVLIGSEAFLACCVCLGSFPPLLVLISVGGRVFDEISFRENFAKLATKRFSCFAKMRDEFRKFRSFAKLPKLRKKQFSRNTKIAKMKKT
jgi:hypothetical protein